MLYFLRNSKLIRSTCTCFRSFTNYIFVIWLHYPPILSVLKLCIICYAFDISNYKRNRVSICYTFNISNHIRNWLEFANNSHLCKHVLHDHKVEQYTMGQLLPEFVFAILQLSMLSRSGIMKLTGWLEPSCCKKQSKKVPTKKLVWGIEDVWRFWMIPNRS